jgi:hypothetical protein
MRPVLGVTRSEEEDSGPGSRRHHSIDAQLDLTQHEYEKCLQASNALLAHIADNQLFVLVLWNYEEYCAVLSDSLNAYRQKDLDYFDRRPVYLNVNSCLLNYLASVRTYLDYTETRIKRRYGEESERWRGFKRQCSDAYDASFSYRFLYRLRNYAQHCGLPINRIRFKVQPTEEDPNQPDYSLWVGIVRDELLQAFDWGNLEEEIAALPSEFEINPLLDEMTSQLDNINNSLAAEELPALTEHANYIKATLARISYKHEDGDPCIFELAETEGGDIDWTHLAMRRIPVEIADAIIEGNIEDISRTITVCTI